MPRLIDANALISYFSGGETMKTMTQSIYDAMFVKALQSAPTVDAEEVVRCGQCKHWEQYYRLTDRKEPAGCGECRLISMDISMNAGDFCSYGERKDNDG